MAILKFFFAVKDKNLPPTLAIEGALNVEHSKIYHTLDKAAIVENKLYF